MHAQSHTTSDGLISLVSESTRTVNAQHPEGVDDWIIALTPGGWHIHPDDYEPNESFISDILEDRTTLVVWYKEDEIVEVSVLNPHYETIESEIARFKSDPIPGLSVTYRLWSGKLLAQWPIHLA